MLKISEGMSLEFHSSRCAHILTKHCNVKLANRLFKKGWIVVISDVNAPINGWWFRVVNPSCLALISPFADWDISLEMPCINPPDEEDLHGLGY